VQYSYWTKNPFRSIYFACLAMAGELASGLLSTVNIEKSGHSIALLVVGMQAQFTKKAVGVITFSCQQGEEIQSVIQKAIETGEGQTIHATSIGTDEVGDEVARFQITWSYKVRATKPKA
jgi:hypothetical protein